MGDTDNAVSSSTSVVWRDGDRIRRGDSLGYGDMVPDGEIWGHLADHALVEDAEMVAFCAQVLILRRREARGLTS